LRVFGPLTPAVQVLAAKFVRMTHTTQTSTRLSAIASLTPGLVLALGSVMPAPAGGRRRSSGS
jgi:hypothetical protein